MKTIKVQLLLNRINVDLTSMLTYVHKYNLEHNITIDFDIQAMDVKGYTSVYTQVRPGIWYWILTGAEKIVTIESSHDITIFMFDLNEWHTVPGSHFPLQPNTPNSSTVPVSGKPFINLGFYSQDPVGTEVTFAHELMHAYTELANASGFPTVDQMDTYYLNSTPEAPNGNFSIQWAHLQPWLISNNQLMNSIQQSTLDLIIGFEGFRTEPYQDIGGVWTIGIGFTHLNNMPVTAQTPAMTLAQAQTELKIQLQSYATAVIQAVGKVLTQNQFDACCSLCYNIGEAGFESSTVCRDIVADNFTGAADAFLLWDKVGGVNSQGLLNRRTAERALFLQN